MTLEEIATALITTVSAVKAALHRGRGKLRAPTAEGSRAPLPPALDAFCAAFNARDIGALTALLLSDAKTEVVGVVTEYGKHAPSDTQTGSLTYGLKPIIRTEKGGIAEQHLEGYLGGAPRCEAREHRGEWVLLFWFDHVGGPAVRAVWTSTRLTTPPERPSRGPAPAGYAWAPTQHRGNARSAAARSQAPRFEWLARRGRAS